MTMLTSLLLLSAAFALGDANSLLEEDLCPSGWTKYGSRCLMFVKTTRSWPEAERYCVSLGDQLVSVPNVVKYLGANLASVHSSEEDQFLQALVLVKTVGFPPTWTGGFYSVKDRRWFWSDGSDFDHQNWAKGRPGAGARESCVHINFGAESSGQQRWDNALCERSLPSVCSLRLLPLRQSIH
ncbi:ladderlectin-like isoform X1 [Oncorhynchus kisutch]|uniref:ladderlectin-like isoform X1 n=1 Tax=Oncorhynchus kisutch TaxID=8019 RepID=UPI0012DE1B81|nr:ladderlectin-like isoform X1 [Oncorhynchus kisutch]XP_031647508.1 ladderlectin-like isoform X1 [Oncorhynchus kisutch]XP_031647509.1 ladderlectin-like isoform X1 [Oncorhynchus kisutch]